MRIRRTWIPLFLLPALFFFCRCSPSPEEAAPYEYTEPENTGDGWQTGTLASVGMDASFFENLVNDIQNGVYSEVHSLLVARNNRLVFEKYWPGHDFSPYSSSYHGMLRNFDRDMRHNTHSATKSFTSALIGIGLDQGLIHSKNDTIFDYLPENYDAWKNQGREYITIAHCLMMASGLEWNEWDAGTTASDNDLVRFNQSADPIAYLLAKPLRTPPGSSFYYNGATVDLLGVLLANAAEQSVPVFSAAHLFETLGISNYKWETLFPSGMTCCHGDIHITPRDMGKFGQLFLGDGEWNGNRIISREWVEQSTRNQINPGVGWANGYGYLWWLRDLTVGIVTFHSFKALGWGGQEIFVFKDLDMVVVFTGANYVTAVPCDKIVQNYILPSLGH